LPLPHIEPEFPELVNQFVSFNHWQSLAITASWILLEDLRPVLKTSWRTFAEDAPRYGNQVQEIPARMIAEEKQEKER
jgi:hypothetical protein